MIAKWKPEPDIGDQAEGFISQDRGSWAVELRHDNERIYVSGLRTANHAKLVGASWLVRVGWDLAGEWTYIQ